MVRISLKGLAKFMTANSSQQRKVLRDFKYPDPEGHAQARYYREAKNYIVAYHKGNHDRIWLFTKSVMLKTKASQSRENVGIRYAHNARAVRQYLRHFGMKKYTILQNLSFTYQYCGVVIKVVPDLHVREKSREKIIKLDFTTRKPVDKAVKIITQMMFETQSSGALELSGSSILYLDVPRGTIYKGSRIGSRIRREIEDACKNIAALWIGIKK